MGNVGQLSVGITNSTETSYSDLVIEFIVGGIEINLLAFSYKKATGRGR